MCEKQFINSNWNKYKQYRNKLTALIRLSKQKYDQNFFNSNIKNMRQTWKGINELLGSMRKKWKTKNINFIRSNENAALTSDPKTIGNTLNEYFATVGNKLASANYYTALIGTVTNQEPRKTIGYCLENNRLYCFPNPRWRRLFSANQEVN